VLLQSATETAHLIAVAKNFTQSEEVRVLTGSRESDQLRYELPVGSRCTEGNETAKTCPPQNHWRTFVTNRAPNCWSAPSMPFACR
jgi:hypothetical protein